MEPGFPRYFIALPDCERAAAVAELLPGASVLRHASGRPWVLHTYPADQVVVGAAGADGVAVLGHSSAARQRLREAAGSDRRVTALAHELDGSFHLVARSADGVRAQGSASGVRRVFHAELRGVPVLCDRADVPAALGGFELDDTALALRVLRQLPHPLADEPIWRGVHPVPPERFARVRHDRPGWTAQTWWQRPDPELSRAEGAELLRESLRAAVAVRTRGGKVHCDLSGGMDSTSVCYFAAETAPDEVLATTGYNGDPGGMEDLRWARRALPAMPGVRHDAHSLDEMPQFYEGLATTGARMDEPTGAQLASPRMQVNLRMARERGAEVYLNGLGGDHVLCGLPVWEHALFRHRPLLAWRRARQNQMLRGESALRTLRGLADSRSYRQWLAELADTAPSTRMERTEVGFQWELGFTWPRWLTSASVHSARERIAQLAAETTPLGPDRAAHSELAMVRDGARLVRGTRQLGEQAGVEFETPYFDDRVLAACLAVRRAERVSPKEFKPLIKEAMRGLLPDEFLRRTTKTGGTAQSARGYAAHHPELLELCTGSELVRRGVVDPDALREHARPVPGQRPDLNIDSTLTCAVFLRNRLSAPVARPTPVR